MGFGCLVGFVCFMVVFVCVVLLFLGWGGGGNFLAISMSLDSTYHTAFVTPVVED